MSIEQLKRAFEPFEEIIQGTTERISKNVRMDEIGPEAIDEGEFRGEYEVVINHISSITGFKTKQSFEARKKNIRELVISRKEPLVEKSALTR